MSPVSKIGAVTELWQQDGRMSEDLLYSVGSFVERLIARGGKERFLRLLKRQTIEDARAIYGADFDRFVRVCGCGRIAVAG